MLTLLMVIFFNWLYGSGRMLEKEDFSIPLPSANYCVDKNARYIFSSHNLILVLSILIT